MQQRSELIKATVHCSHNTLTTQVLVQLESVGPVNYVAAFDAHPVQLHKRIHITEACCSSAMEAPTWHRPDDCKHVALTTNAVNKRVKLVSSSYIHICEMEWDSTRRLAMRTLALSAIPYPPEPWRPVGC